MQGSSGASGYIVFVFFLFKISSCLGWVEKKSRVSLFVLRIYPFECFCFVSFLAQSYDLWIMLSRAYFMNFMTSKSSLTAEKKGRDLISRLSFSFRGWTLRAWLMKEHNLAYDLWAALREQDGTTKFAGIFGLDWNVCRADFLYQQNALLRVFDELGWYTSFLTYKHGTTNWYDDICDKTGYSLCGFRAWSEMVLSTLLYFRLLLMDIYLLRIPYFPTRRHFPRKRLPFDNINLRAGAIDGLFLFGDTWIWDGIAGVFVGGFWTWGW